jgi:hypothetical protein
VCVSPPSHAAAMHVCMCVCVCSVSARLGCVCSVSASVCVCVCSVSARLGTQLPQASPAVQDSAPSLCGLELQGSSTLVA